MFSIDPEAELQRLQLNYGYIEVGTMQGRFNISYNAPGIAGNRQNLFPYQIESYRLLILATGTRNVKYIQQYVDLSDAGGCVGECVTSKFFPMENCDLVQSGCEAFQGGFVKFWTRTELLDAQGPYLREIDDSVAIQSYIDYTPPPPTSYTVQIMAPIGNGSVRPTPKVYTFSNTECFRINAVAGLGWEFSHWVVNGRNYLPAEESFCYNANGYVVQAFFIKPSNGNGDGNGTTPINSMVVPIAIGALVLGAVALAMKGGA